MSDEARARAAAREFRIWSPFQYAAVFDSTQEEERTMLFGMYAGAYLNRHNYMEAIEAVELANLLADYNAKIAALTNDEAILVASIVAKRYVANIDKLIHDEKMLVFQGKIDDENALWDARIAALATDEAALATIMTRYEVETLKTAARISELQAQIATEEINEDLVEVEVAKKEIQLEEVNLRILNVASEVLRLQLRIVQTGLELVEVDYKKAQLRRETAQVEMQIAKTSLLESELATVTARAAGEAAELTVAQSAVDIINARIENVAKEVIHYETLGDHEVSMLAARLNLMTVDTNARIERLNNFVDRKVADANLKIATAKQLEDVADLEAGLRKAVTNNQLDIDDEREDISDDLKNAAIDAATTLASATVTSTLSHSISQG